MNQVTKNNSVILEGLTIMECDRNIYPTIYLNEYYETYKKGDSIDTVVYQILQIYYRSKIDAKVDMDFFANYGEVKKRIVYKLVHFEKNQALLSDVPFFPYLDLAIVFYCLLQNSPFGNASIVIHNSHCKMWDITAEELYFAAKENTKELLPVELKNMEDVIRELLQETEESNSKILELEGGQEELVPSIENSARENQLYVLSNLEHCNGAASILYDDVLKNFADQLQSDLYILPSSIHEVILLPVNSNDNPEKLTKMVQEVNEAEVEREDILSDHVYYYRRNCNTIEMK